MKKVLCLIVAVFIALSAVSCSNPPTTDLWENATYKQDTVLGDGSKTVVVEVKAEDKSVNFTLKTDAKTLGEALLSHNLISGDMGDFGLYIKYVNGILADYDVDSYYWGFYKDGEYMLTGVDTTEIKDGEHYELVRTK